MRVWVAGLGLIGQSVAQASRALGAHVTVTDLDPRRLEIAEQLGAHRVIDISDDSAVESLAEGGPYDRIVDACGAPDLFDFIYEHKLLALYGAIGALAGRQPTVFHQTMLHASAGVDRVVVALYVGRSGDSASFLPAWAPFASRRW